MNPQREQADGEAGAPMVTHLLSFDVEEYFQVEAAARVGCERWDGIPSRLDAPVDRILGLLAEHGASATFFVLGWIAERRPDLVRRISDAGHEIASHGMGHRMIGRLGAEEFGRDLADSRALLEDACGAAVIGYRAPTFSLTHRTAWAIDALAERGFRYDSSVFPIRHDRYGVPDAPAGVHRAVGPGGGSVLEIPPLTMRVMGANWPVGGGGYLRLLPVRLVAAALRSAGKRRDPGMLYLHPWEFDPGQPALPMGRIARWRHRVGLRRTERKLGWLLQRFRFSAVSRHMGELDVTARQSYHYGRQE